MAEKRQTLRQRAAEVLELARKKGVSTNFFFETTFDRYMTQLDIMDKLKKIIKKDGMLVEKEYVKGRANLYTNPAIAEYNKTATAANSTVATLVNIVKSFGAEDAENAPDDLEEFRAALEE